MAQCVSSVVVNGVSVLQAVVVSPCTTFVLLTPAEYESMSASPFNLSLTDASLIVSSVLGVWGIAYCWRSLAGIFSGRGSED